MTVLGIETSGAVCSVGLTDGKGISTERSVVESHIHSEKLLTLVQEVCALGRIRISNIDGIAVSIGPGSFTGLRIGLSAAKGLSAALNKPLMTVSTFEAIAESAFVLHKTALYVLLCVDAKQGDFYVGAFERVERTTVARISVSVQTLEALKGHAMKLPAIILTDRKEALERVFDSESVFDDIQKFCRGDVVADLGLRKLLKNETSDVGTTEPMYLKDFVVKKRAT